MRRRGKRKNNTTVMIHYFEELTSSNDEAASAAYAEGDVVWAEYQTAGRGQRGHRWESAGGDNITFTLVLEPSFLAAERQFLLSEAVTLGIVDCLAEYGIAARIKWTNDIYIGDRKVTGMLIEHRLSEGRICRTLAGIGVNVNQTVFDPSLPNPVSMAQAAGRTFERRPLLERLVACIMSRYGAVREGGAALEALRRDYHGHLYRLGEEHWYALPDGERFRGTIRGVEDSGALRVEDAATGAVRGYLFREIEFVLKN